MTTELTEPTTASSDANSYRMFVGAESSLGVIETATDQFGAWLRSKKDWDPPLDGSRFATDSGRELATLRHESSDGAALRIRLAEDTKQGTWRTQLTVAEPRAGSAWLSLQVTNSEGRWVAVPGLARNLLQSLRATDGDAELSSTCRVISPDAVDELAEDVCDVNRRGLFFVAGTRRDSISFDSFKQQVERWARQVTGLAQVAILTPDATDLFREALGEEHRVHPWSIRTFYPGVDPAIATDGLRHRWLSRQRLIEEPDETIRQLLGRIARRHSTAIPSRDEYVRIDRAFSRLENRILIDEITIDRTAEVDRESEPALAEVEVPEFVSPIGPGSEVTDNDAAQLARQAEQYLADVELVKRVLGLDELNEDALRSIASSAQQAHTVAESVSRVSRQLADQQARLQELEDENRAAQDELDDLRLDERIAAEEAGKLADENRWLKQRLAASGAADAFAPVPEGALTNYPSDFGDLYDRRAELAALGVIVTADPGVMRDIDEYDTVSKLVTTAWDCLLVLGDYLRARREGVCSSNVKDYLRAVPNGFRGVPPKKFAEKETSITMDNWGDLRSFPVDPAVEPSGLVTMEAHFKLGRVGRVSPRLYYLDCYAKTGKVYVGYIGAHLRNTQT